ncbi:MAG TPA: mannose-1-phosphate guanylyltransferase [Tenuifilaceae bacterium]|nr:mannose-1-phosphate guanylyltransferase [Tenuifilaceae bacterium]HPE17444.1 mannose-1-phosphate guanylyltransferase [Tenuifilaceae bacterium]HPJ45607.1 mannose-1-phosphate guanylyltransferase [Tenuifilaceae bacterium]HPQ33477.1 mannose-1-phosphate guanylyltransferase [Tenuifilaceae bacterium]HRX66990.1 mannose-1-phosphate guanylyltransferase [Tenuifilaceae bacterium]
MQEKNNVYCVIMAGGVGSRFWPLSRQAMPKQFLDILGTGSSLLQQTFSRATNFCPPENVYIVTGTQYKDLVLAQIPSISSEQIILEPMRRNTAPCIAFANEKIRKRNPNALVVVAPSDHLILDQASFIRTIETSLSFAQAHEALITIGIKPSRPETGYGYIQVKKQVEKNIPNLFKVKTFTEKPSLEMAELFLETGEFYWNSGVFVWSLSAISSAFTKYLPEVSNLFSESSKHYNTQNEAQIVYDIYSECKNISIDYGIMEKADNVYVICSEFGWSDLGTWGSLYLNSAKDAHGNTVSGSNVMHYDVSNSLINFPNDKLVVVQGLSDYILVERDNILLICKKENEQEIKQYLNNVIIEKGDRFI